MNAPLLLPPNSTDLEKALAQIDANRISGIDVDIIRRIHDPDQCPEEFLPVLAWEYSVDEWDPAWPADTKRAVIKVSYEVHRHKGTAYAMETAIEATGLGAKVEEWFEYDGSPYRFRLTVDLQPDQIWPIEDHNRLVRTALRTKNVRSRLESILFRRSTTGEGPFVGGVVRIKTRARIEPYVARNIDLQASVFVAGFARFRQTIRIYPEN